MQYMHQKKGHGVEFKLKSKFKLVDPLAQRTRAVS